MTKIVRLLVAAAAVCVAAAAAQANAARSTIVLGANSLNYAGSGHHRDKIGVGWGTAHPATVFTGGDPSGFVGSIRWSDWGDRQAIGYGLTSLPAPEGGYYPGRYPVELRAYNIGRCTRNDSLVYRSLEAREPDKPGAPLGRWYRWGGWPSICAKSLGTRVSVSRDLGHDVAAADRATQERTCQVRGASGAPPRTSSLPSRSR